MSSDFDEAIEKALSVPAEVSGDAGRVKQHDPVKLVEAAQLACNEAVKGKRKLPIRFAKVIPPDSLGENAG